MKNVPINIEHFDVSYNLIQGTVPQLESLNEVRHLNFSANALLGTLLPGLSAFLNLQQLDLSNQKRGLSGTIPDRLLNLPYLTVLELGGNMLTGQIPAAFGNLGQLKILGLADNLLTGIIPAELGNTADMFM